MLQRWITLSGEGNSVGKRALSFLAAFAAEATAEAKAATAAAAAAAASAPRPRRHAPRKREAQYICHQRLRADGSKDTQTSSDEESEAEVEEEEEESDDEFCDRTTSPVPKWEVLAMNRAVCVGAALPATAAGSGEFGLEGTERVLVDPQTGGRAAPGVLA
jgi:hypothetical protein